MKKIFTMLLVVAMLVACLAMTASAATAGETVTVEFTIKGNPGFASYNAVIDYDATALKLVEVKEGDLTTGKGMFYANPENGNVGFAGSADVTGEGVLFVATFEVNALDGNYPVTAALVENSSSNAANEPVTFEIVGDIVEVACDHNWEFVGYNGNEEPTCTEGAKAVYKCTICGTHELRNVEALGHKWGKWEVTKAATCHEEGVETRICENDPAHKETRVIEKLEHVPGEPVKENIVEATQTTDGSYDLVVYCVLCGDELSRETVIVPALGLDDEPNTGDFTPVLAMFVIVVMMVPALLVKKFRAVK